MGELSNGPIPDAHVRANRGVANRRPQTGHIMWGRRAADHHYGEDLVIKAYVSRDETGSNNSLLQ